MLAKGRCLRTKIRVGSTKPFLYKASLFKWNDKSMSFCEKLLQVSIFQNNYLVIYMNARSYNNEIIKFVYESIVCVISSL